ncbi:vesicle-associated protein 1-2-like [Impatiens glandulifera]|uniref:vesicle-associated protein 1-2-like n=1 Tax=Impatiens glandulifera TaxID=253017 RepID=UPI001FB0D1DC|nr:vesicle-associated protein 1-2-like [Impatiens glandulifera]XP_047314971.1 vesicle-associated protein 1-2-like [Impatiens glandulifera]
MSDGELLTVEPHELQFPLELKKQISSSLQLTNKTDNHVAFKVKTTNPKKYCVRPNTGLVSPHSTCDVTVTMQAQKEIPPDLQCKDRFLLQSVVASATTNDITAEMFNKESGNNVEECKLRVTYIAPQKLPSPSKKEGPWDSVSDNGTVNTSEYTGISKASSGRSHAETEDNVSEVKTLISELTKEKNSAIQLNNKLHQELETLRRKTSKNNGEFSFLHVILVGLVGLLIGYLVKQS